MKRKTYTSTEVKARYNARVYDRTTVTLQRTLGRTLRELAAERNESLNHMITHALLATYPELMQSMERKYPEQMLDLLLKDLRHE